MRFPVEEAQASSAPRVKLHVLVDPPPRAEVCSYVIGVHFEVALPYQCLRIRRYRAAHTLVHEQGAVVVPVSSKDTRVSHERASKRRDVLNIVPARHDTFSLVHLAFPEPV